MPEQTILEEASSIVDGSRNHDYGHPRDNHGTTAALWSAYISRKLGINIHLDAEDVCMLNILQKTSRQAHRRKRDNLVDICGYARNAEICAPQPPD